MEEIAREIIRKQIHGFSPDQKGWEYIANCIGAEICPQCGGDIFVNEGILDKGIGKTIFFECSACDWKNYDYAKYRL